jgi:hypothetical protein
MLTHSRDLRMTAIDGVSPPISNADTSSILSAPAYCMAKESKGEVDMTYNKGIQTYLSVNS